MNSKNVDIGSYITPPTLDKWKRLYDLAEDFIKMKPWEWMTDRDLFGVQNPSGEDDGYCCALGNAGEFFGFEVCLGDEGLQTHLKILNREIAIHDEDVLYVKKCLLFSLNDRQYLTRNDLDIINKLGLKFKGRNAWPQFQGYYPGFFPWYLTDKEAEFLIICFEQAKEVAPRFKENPFLFISPDTNKYYGRMLGDDNKWHDTWVEPKTYQKKETTQKEIDKDRFDSLLKKYKKIKQIWEISSFYGPAYITPKDKRPYFPITTLFVDNGSGFIINVNIAEHDKHFAEYDELFSKTVERAGFLPEEIWVKNNEVFSLNQRITDYIGLKLRIVEKLPNADFARKDMSKQFSKRPR